MTKLRAVSVADGRIGWPEVLEYELCEGPDIGKRIPVPPTFETHPHPDPVALFRAYRANTRATCAYRTIVHDPKAYQGLYLAGHIYGPPHCFPPETDDNSPGV